MGATPRDMSLIYALPQNSPQDCFDLRDALALISRHGRLRVPDGATAVKDYDGGNLYGTSVANLNVLDVQKRFFQLKIRTVLNPRIPNLPEF